jgi:hypothetical protein
MVVTLPLAPCPFCAHESPLLAALGDDRVRYVAVLCSVCGAIGPRATGEDPPGYAEAMWNERHEGRG